MRNNSIILYITSHPIFNIISFYFHLLSFFDKCSMTLMLKNVMSVEGDMYEREMWETIRGQDWTRTEKSPLWSQKRDWFEVVPFGKTFRWKMWIRIFSNSGKLKNIKIRLIIMNKTKHLLHLYEYLGYLNRYFSQDEFSEKLVWQ